MDKRLTVEENLPDWELDRITKEIEELGEDIPDEVRKLLAIKMLKALQLDIQEGRVESMVISVVGGLNDKDQIKNFQWIMCNSTTYLPLLSKAIIEVKAAIDEAMKGEIIRRLRNFFQPD